MLGRGFDEAFTRLPHRSYKGIYMGFVMIVGSGKSPVAFLL